MVWRRRHNSNKMKIKKKNNNNNKMRNVRCLDSIFFSLRAKVSMAGDASELIRYVAFAQRRSYHNNQQ